MKNELSEAEKLLLEVLVDACATGETVSSVRFDSACIQSYTDALLYFIDKGVLRNESMRGRRVICRYSQ